MGDAVPSREPEKEDAADGKSIDGEARDSPLRAAAVAAQAPCAEDSNGHGKTKHANGKPGQASIKQKQEDADCDDDLTVPVTESVWLLAGRTEMSYAAFSEAVSSIVDEAATDAESNTQGAWLSHLVPIGSDAPGGETASIGRLTR